MNPLELKTNDLPTLAGLFSLGNIILFTGAGFSLDAHSMNGEKIPSTWALTEKLWALCFPGEEIENNTNLSDVYDNALMQHKKKLTALLNDSFHVDKRKSPKWYADLLSMPWGKIYTLNIDNLISTTISDISSIRDVNTISGTTGKRDELRTDKLNVIHLNGRLSDVPDNVIFSRLQYATNAAHDFYKDFTQEFLTKTVVFIGTSLDEDILWQHIINRFPKGNRANKELRPRSYLVTPTLNKSRLSQLSKYNTVWLQMTGEEFQNSVLEKLAEAKSVGNKYLNEISKHESAHNTKIKFVSNLLEEKSVPTEYLLGAEPTWSDLLNSKIAKRNCFSDLKKIVDKLRAATNVSEFLIVTGTAGTGKSSALKWLANYCNSEGLITGWLDENTVSNISSLKKNLRELAKLDVIIIDSADIYKGAICSLINEIRDLFPRAIIILEIRSTKISSTINPSELPRDFIATEYAIPNLADDDIDQILEVLTIHNRLGKLKNQTKQMQQRAFKKNAGSQLLVAMYQATTGKKHENRALDELNELSNIEKFIYGIVATASTLKIPLSRQEILASLNNYDNNDLNTIKNLINRKILIYQSKSNDLLKARHRVIAQLVYNELVNKGTFESFLRGLFSICTTSVTQYSDSKSRTSRLLKHIINHRFIMDTIRDLNIARSILGEYEQPLEWNAHYWLHRGAIELETNHLDLAENFLDQASGIKPNDLYIQSEWAYLHFKKAISKPDDLNSPELVEDAFKSLESIIVQDYKKSAHAFHILGKQGLEWASIGIKTYDKKKNFLQELESKMRQAMRYFPADKSLISLSESVKKAILQLAVK